MKVIDLMQFIINNNLKENDEILIRISENNYRELKPDIVNMKLGIISKLLNYYFISL